MTDCLAQLRLETACGSSICLNCGGGGCGCGGCGGGGGGGGGWDWWRWWLRLVEMVVVGLAVETACGSSISQNCQKSCGSFQPANYCLDYCHSALLARVHCYNIVRSWR